MTGFPDMGEAFQEWSDATTFLVITKSLVDGDLVETPGTETAFDMLLYPMKAQQVAMKPEGQRSWRWMTGVSAYQLKIDDIVKDEDGVKYRVAGIEPYVKAGFYVYELTEAFQ